MRFDQSLNRVFIDLMSPATGEVVSTMPPRVLLQTFSKLVGDTKGSEVDTAA